MLRYFLATYDQVVGSLSDRMLLFFRRPDRVKMCYTRKFGKFRSSGNQKKQRMHLSASSFEDTSVFIDHRYVIQVLWVGVKKKKGVRTDTKCRFTDRHRKEIQQ